VTTFKNPFPVPSALQKVYLNELSRVAARCYERGWSWGTAGNFSIRGSDGLIWQSPTGLCKGELRPELFVAVDLQSENAVESWTQKPSAEMPVHAGIYKAVADAGCVVHTHPPRAVAASKGRRFLEFKNEEMGKALGAKCHTHPVVIPILPNGTPEEMRAYSSRVAAGIPDIAKVLVLDGHGVWAWGKTPLEAMAYLEALEFLCQQVYL
jgi:ribulose-5-phosphate 4-epimerase/fuculose-1-phosphate aldolase